MGAPKERDFGTPSGGVGFVIVVVFVVEVHLAFASELAAVAGDTVGPTGVPAGFGPVYALGVHKVLVLHPELGRRGGHAIG